MNSFTVGLFLDEFSSFLEGLVLAPSALLIAGDFNFHVDDQEDDDTRRFLQVLELFDLTQHVSHSNYKYGNTLDLIITRANDDLVGQCFVHDPLISDHLAVHVSLHLAKLPPERRSMSYRRIRAIDFHEFCRDLENSSLVRDAETLKSLLDTYAPLRTKTITLRPTASWYNDEFRSEKRRRRALECRWRSSKLECDRLRFQEQSCKVNNLIKATKMEFYSGIIRDCSNSQTLFNTVSKLLHGNTPVDYPSTCESDTDLANKFIDFFGDKIAVIRNALDGVLDSILDFDDNVSFSDQFTLSSFRSVTSS